MANGFWDTLFGGIGDAIADVRSKIIDEGWFGRSDAASAVERAGPEPVAQSLYGSTRSFEEEWAPRSPADIRSPAAEREAPGIDR